MNIRIMSELSDRIIAYITSHSPVTMETLIRVAGDKGFTEEEVLQALQAVHKDPRIRTASGHDSITYVYAPPRAPQHPMGHVEWVTAHYPWPGRDGVPPFVMPFPEWSLSWMFLTPEEMIEYKACQKGNPSLRFKRKSYDTSKSRGSSHGDRTTSHSGTGTSTMGTERIGLTPASSVSRTSSLSSTGGLQGLR